MDKLEKVIKGLELCRYDPDPGQECKFMVSCAICPYFDDNIGCTQAVMFNDALELLKAQEPIAPIHTDKYTRTEPITFEYKCAVCEVGLMRHWVCCPTCGTKVKWNG